MDGIMEGLGLWLCMVLVLVAFQVFLESATDVICAATQRLRPSRRAFAHHFIANDGCADRLKPQFDIMRKYKHILEQRAIAESIDLDNDDVVMW